MTDDEVLRQLRTIRFSPAALRIGRRIPGVRTVARYAGLSFRTLYSIINSGHLTEAQAKALESALQAVQELR
jgi:hypothetical protein